MLFRTLKRVLALYLLFLKFHALLCLTTLSAWAHCIFLRVFNETKEFTHEVCSWTRFKRAKAKFFCFKVEACCEHAITFIPVFPWRVPKCFVLPSPVHCQCDKPELIGLCFISQKIKKENSLTLLDYLQAIILKHFLRFWTIILTAGNLTQRLCKALIQKSDMPVCILPYFALAKSARAPL